MKKFIILTVLLAVAVAGLVSCDTSNVCNHSGCEWVASIPVTCTEGGEEVFACSCGYRRTRNVAALGHSYETDETGIDTCSTCGERSYFTYSTKAVAKLYEKQLLSNSTIDRIKAGPAEWENTPCILVAIKLSNKSNYTSVFFNVETGEMVSFDPQSDLEAQISTDNSLYDLCAEDHELYEKAVPGDTYAALTIRLTQNKVKLTKLKLLIAESNEDVVVQDNMDSIIAAAQKMAGAAAG